MRQLLTLLILTLSGFAHGSDVASILNIRDDGAGAASLSFYNYDPKVLELFEAKKLQGGGYTWESLVKAALGGVKPHGVEFDPEGDAFYAYASSASSLASVKEAIGRLVSDPEFMEECIVRARQGGYLE